MAIEGLERVFLRDIDLQDLSRACLLITDGHGSHAVDEFMIECALNNVYLLFLLAHTYRITQPLDVGAFRA
jgi:hypothetical protein